MKKLDEEKLRNLYRDVKTFGQSGMRMKQAAAKIGKTKSGIIKVHAGANNLSSTSPEEFQRKS